MSPRLTYCALLAGLAIGCSLGYTPGAAHAVWWMALGALLAMLARKHTATVFFALLPLASLGASTGGLFVEEFDCLLVGAAASALAREDWQAPALPGVVWLWVAVWLMAMGRGLIGEGALSDYATPWNALRVGKSLLLALVMLPLMRTAAHWLWGHVAGLAAVSTVCLWERAAFPGVGNFAADYRTTGPFWEMHVGGAALDAYLALTVPCALWWLARARGVAALCALVLFALASYAVVSSFSRGLYVAYVVGLAVAVLAATRGRARVGRVVAGGLLASVAACVTLVWVFATGGYRATAAVALVMLAGLWLAERPAPIARVLSWAALGALACLGVALVHDKGAYAAFALTACSGLAARLRRAGGALVWAVALTLGFAAGQVAFHWGGARAAWAAALTVGGALSIAAGSAAGVLPRWVVTRGVAIAWALALMLASSVAILAASDFLEQRLAAVQRDSTLRAAHWAQSLARWQHEGAAARWLGAGLGRYPALSGAHEAGLPGLRSHEYGLEGTPTGLRLRATTGEPLRIAQRLHTLPREPLALTLRVRSSAPAHLAAAVCFKHLLYAESCAEAVLPVRTEGQWQDRELMLDASTLQPGPWYAPRDAMFVLRTSHGVVDVASVSLAARDGELLDNREFSHPPWRWFFTSDHHHLPWHAKQFFLGVLIEQGVLGVLVWLAVLLAAIVRLARADTPEAAYVLAGVVGCMVVGLFDSLLDVPRVAFLLCCFLLWQPAAQAQGLRATAPRLPLAGTQRRLV